MDNTIQNSDNKIHISKKIINILSYEMTKNLHGEHFNDMCNNSILCQITENIRPGTIKKLKNVSNDFEFLDYTIPSGKKAYRDIITNNTPYFDRDLVYQLIEKLFSKKKETHTSKTINNIIDLMVGHSCIKFYEKIFNKNIEKVSNIKKNYNQFVLEVDEMYDKIFDEFDNIAHECINFQFRKYCSNSNCIICGEILIKPENYIPFVDSNSNF